MIDIISGSELRHLADTQDRYCVSIYLPTHRAGQETAQDEIRLKNAVADAQSELVALGMRAPEAEALLSPVTALSDEAQFWAHLDQGLAVFASGGQSWAYRLADLVEELVVVADRFHIKPLMPLVATGEVFYILALGQNEVRLLRGSRYRVSDLALGEIPPSLAEALWFDDREAQLHSHTALRTGTGQVTATFHGQGVGTDTKDADLKRFLSAVDAGVAQVVGAGPAPLVLAGVGSTVAQYRLLNTYPHLIESAIEGSAESLSGAEIHDRAWPLVEVVFDESRRRARESVESGVAATTDTLPEALIAAHNGRVASVFVPIGVQRWGTFDAEGQDVEEHDKRQSGDRDLLDATAVETLVHGGDVFAVNEDDVPRGGVIAVALRF